MAYPEKILADDEKVVEHLHPHWITLVPATLVPATPTTAGLPVATCTPGGNAVDASTPSDSCVSSPADKPRTSTRAVPARSTPSLTAAA